MGATAVAFPVISCSEPDRAAVIAGISPVAPGTDDEVVWPTDWNTKYWFPGLTR